MENKLEFSMLSWCLLPFRSGAGWMFEELFLDMAFQETVSWDLWWSRSRRRGEESGGGENCIKELLGGPHRTFRKTQWPWGCCRISSEDLCDHQSAGLRIEHSAPRASSEWRPLVACRLLHNVPIPYKVHQPNSAISQLLFLSCL